MRAIGEREVLDAWERCQGQHPLDQAISLILLDEPDSDRGRMAELSVGERDSRLLDRYAAQFGPRIQANADCPACGEAIEFEARAEDLRAPAAIDPEFTVEAGGRTLRFRLPNSRDLAAVCTAGNDEEGVRLLIGRCLLSPAEAELTAEDLERIGEAMAKADPASDILIELRCPACGHEWAPVFDVLPFLLGAFQRQSAQVLAEVHGLAAAYGWTEPEILDLGPLRRRSYLQLVSG